MGNRIDDMIVHRDSSLQVIQNYDLIAAANVCHNCRMSQYPVLIQGGMGAGVSDWRLARAVSLTGQLGVVSSTALDTIFSRRLQDGDPGGHMRRGLAMFPFPAMAERVLEKHFIAWRQGRGFALPAVPMLARVNSREATELLVVSNFVEVALAREGHTNPVGVNCMEKLQHPLLASLYGSMLAGAGYILMGAGIPLKVPACWMHLPAGQPASYPLSVSGAKPDDDCLMRFDPKESLAQPMPPLERPRFLAIISSNTLATTMVRRSNGKVDGFVIEGPTAGGHNAPPRGPMVLSAKGECVYGERDRVDLDKIRQIGFLLARRKLWHAGKDCGGPGVGRGGRAGGHGLRLSAKSPALRQDYKCALLEKD